ncbi:hypothetical protein V8C34DRAFT_315543 [Trichoderma compactum]
MSVVAVAGGTGNVGRTIVETLAQSSKHKVIVLARKAQAVLEDVSTFAVNYTDVDATAKLLKQHNVGAVISAIQVTDDTSSAAEIGLIKAAEQSSTVSRFIASGWRSLPSEASPTAAFSRASENALRNTVLERTRFSVGLFLDYYGMPAIKTHLPPMSFAVDMNSKKAALPGTGNEPCALWEEITYIYGERTSWNEFIKAASEVTVSYDPIEKLAKGEVTELPSHKEELAKSPFPEPLARQLLAVLGCWVVGGQFDIPVDKTLNKISHQSSPWGFETCSLPDRTRLTRIH